MKRIGIYFFCVVAVGCLTSSILYWNTDSSKEKNEKKPPEEQTESHEEEEMTAQVFDLITMQKQEKNGFLLKEEDGYLVVYNQFTSQRYDETTILVSNLPERLKEQLETGLFFENEKALYEFLENYSS